MGKNMKLARKHVLRVKGQAELIGALFALMVLVLLIVYTVANVLPSTLIQQMQMQEVQSFEHFQKLEKEKLEAIWNPENNELIIYNNSTIPVKIVRIWVEEDGSIRPVPVDPGVAIIEPRGEKELDLSNTPLRVETARGTIVDVKTLKPAPRYSSPPPPQPPKKKNETPGPPPNVINPASLGSNPNIYIDRKLIREPTPENVREGKTGGMVRYLVGGRGEDSRRVLVLEIREMDVCVHVEGTPGIFILGYAPGTGNKLYNVLLTGTEVGVEISVRNCTTGEQMYSVRLTSTGHVRAKLLGLNVTEFQFVYQGRPSIATNNASQALGYWYYYIPPKGIEMYLNLSGKVEKLKIYRDDLVESGQESSYEPYLLTADVDGNGVPELIFIDEDISDSEGVCTLNDPSLSRYRMHYIVNAYILDNSTRPFLFYLKGHPIDPKRHGGVMISLRWYFHDNEPADEGCVEDSGLTILGFYLIDPGKDGKLGTQDDKIVASSEYPYQYLTRFEDTYPPNRGYITLTVTLVVPENVTANKLYAAIGFNDPYVYRGPSWDEGWDDVDITLAVELLGITFLPRST